MAMLLETRNIVVVGRTGAGKSTVANKILHIKDCDPFEVKSNPSSVTKEPSINSSEFIRNGVRYNFNVIDTIGLFDPQTITNTEIQRKTRQIIKDRCVDGLHVIVFVVKEGRFTSEEQETFNIIYRDFSTKIDPLSLMVITGCEGVLKDPIINNYKTNPVTKDICSHMSKGIIAVGFPDLSRLAPALKQIHESAMAEDVNLLLDIICNDCKTLHFKKDLYYEAPPQPIYVYRNRDSSGWCNLL